MPPITPLPPPPIAPPLAMVSLWIYVTLLLAGGLVGLIKAGSKISLITSALFAALLALCATGVIHPFWIADIIVGLVAVVFMARYLKTAKFMPSGLMLLFSVVVLGTLLAAR
ncbi:MAG: TMEM14 family protein [Verrucomicrobiota bacterium]